MNKEIKAKKELVKVNGKLKEFITLHDEKGKVIHRVITPLRVEFHLKDALQVIIGASILAIPVGFTEETWRLAETLPLFNVLGFILLSLFFVSTFTYYHYYNNGNLRTHWDEFVKRIFFTYIFSFLVVAILLGMIQRTPWFSDWLLAFKRIAIVTFPSTMSAAVADVIK